MVDPKGCQTTIYDEVSSWQCHRKPTVARDGKLYCKIHDPEYKKAKDKANREKWDRESAKRNHQFILTNAQNKATLGLTIDELNHITPDLIRKVLKEGM